jgi:hypothetical protein
VYSLLTCLNMCARFFVTVQRNPETTMLQVVAVRGINPAGACIVAHQMYTAVPKPVVQTSLDQMQHFAQATGDYDYCFDAIAYVLASHADTTVQLFVYVMPA